jgi:hypothetical protein
MVEQAGSLSFGFEADFSGFTRAADSAGATLDRLAGRADAFASASSASVSRSFDTAAALQARQAAALKADAPVPGGLTTAQVLAGQTLPDTSGDRDDDSAKVLTRLSEQLALLRTVGDAHAAIAERQKIEVEQAKLGSDATAAEKDAVAGLVRQIDAAAAAQAKLKSAQAAGNQAYGFVSSQAAGGIESLVLDGAKLGDVASGLLRSTARQGLQAALTGAGPFAALFNTQGKNGATGGLFGALGAAFSGSGSGFAGLFAEGGSIAPGQWGIVGEKGAEVVAGPAAVTPFGKLPAAGAQTSQVINFNVTAPDPPAFARSQSQMASVLAGAVGRGGRNA